MCLVEEIIGSNLNDEKAKYQHLNLGLITFEIPIWHTQHSFDNKNRNDYTGKYDIDKRSISDEDLADVYQKTLNTFITHVKKNELKEYDSYLIKPKFSTVNIIGSLERPMNDKLLLNWFIRTITIRRNNIATFPGQLIIKEAYDKLQQKLIYVIDKLVIPIEIQIRIDKKLLNRLELQKIKKLHSHLITHQDNIFEWIKNTKLYPGEKITYSDDTSKIDVFINTKTPFDIEFAIVNLN